MEIQQIYEACLDEKITPEYAITNIVEKLGVITAVFYTPQKFTIQNHTARIPFNTQNQSRKIVKIRQQLALMAYQNAKLHGSRLPGEIHISRQASTKDHKKGIEKMLGG